MNTRARHVSALALAWATVLGALVIPALQAGVASAQSATSDLFLHGTGPNNNPPVLFLDGASPSATTPKFKDSGPVNFAGGNPWTDIGTWTTDPPPPAATVTALGDIHTWLGLKNSDDQGTRFDLRAEVYKNDTLIGSGQRLCITGLVRNAAEAAEVLVALSAFSPAELNGTTDTLALRLRARIGTNPGGSKCGGHGNAIGLRAYFDAVSRAARIAVTTTPPPAVTRLYVTNSGDGTVSVADPVTDTVIATLSVGADPRAVAVNPASPRAYVANLGSNTVSVIDTDANTVVNTIGVGTSPFGAAVNPSGTRLYVPNAGSANLSVIDTASESVIATVPGAPGVDVAVNPSGTRVYVADQGGGFVQVIDAGTNTVVHSIPVGGGPAGVAFNPAGTLAYVAQGGPGTVSVIDTASETVVTVIAVGAGATGIDVHPSGTRVYVANRNAASVSVIDTTTNTVIATIGVGGSPSRLAVHSDGSAVYVANFNSNTASKIDTGTNTVVANIGAGSGPFGVALTP